MKDIEFRLMAELMKDSRRSDRDLAKKLNVSQPTVTRTRTRLEKEGTIKEYTMIPDFQKLGFQIMSFTLAKLRKDVSEDDIAVTRAKLRETLKTAHVSTVLTMRGIGADANYVTIAFHESYNAYLRFIDLVRQQPILQVTDIRTFMVNLAETQFRPLSFKTLAEYVVRMKSEENR